MYLPADQPPQHAARSPDRTPLAQRRRGNVDADVDIPATWDMEKQGAHIMAGSIIMNHTEVAHCERIRPNWLFRDGKAQSRMDTYRLIRGPTLYWKRRLEGGPSAH